MYTWDVHYNIIYCWGVLLDGLIIKLMKSNWKTQFNSYKQRSHRNGISEVTKAGCLQIIFRQRNNYLWRFNKGACAWGSRLMSGNKVCLQSFLSLEFPNSGDKDAFYPRGIRRILSHGRLFPSFKGKEGVRVFFYISFSPLAVSQVT